MTHMLCQTKNSVNMVTKMHGRLSDEEIARNSKRYGIANWVDRNMGRIAMESDERKRISIYHDLKNVVMNLPYYYAKINEDEHLHFCKLCGRPETATYMEPIGTRLKKEQICFGCDFWMERRSQYNAQHRRGTILVIDGMVRSDGGEADPRTPFLGHGGARFYIKHLITGRVWTSNNMWFGGEIPDEFRGGMPDNAVLLTKEEYETHVGKEAHKPTDC